MYIKAHLNEKFLKRVFVDASVVFNIMPLATMKKYGKNVEDIIPTTLTMTSFIGHPSHALGVLVADVTIGSKVTRSTFFVIEGKPLYVMILGRDWIHTNECVLSSLHEKLIIWIGDKMEIVEADPNPFPAEVKTYEAIFYSPKMRPIVIPRSYEEGGVETCEWTREGFRLKMLVNP